MQTGCRTAHAGSRLKPLIIQEGTAWKASLPAVLGKTRRTDDRGDRGKVGIIRSPICASLLPASHYATWISQCNDTAEHQGALVGAAFSKFENAIMRIRIVA